MDISVKNKSKLNLMTANELSSILKMNQQVVLRKLASGEIEGYKIGKEWRISEEQLLSFLEKHSNKNSPKDEYGRTIKNFIVNGKLKSIPASRSKRLHILKYLVSKLEDKIYTEKELNNFLRKYHDDFCTLRREFIMNKLLIRKNGKYKIVSWNK